MPAKERFRAMGSDCEVLLIGARPGAMEQVRAEIDRLEGFWSRFIDSSEISRMNAADGHRVAVSPETFELVCLAVEAWRATSGLFDPTVLNALEDAGYDRTFEQLAPADAPRLTGPTPGCSEIVLDAEQRTVALPPGVSFDPGGIGKGYAVDRVTQMLLENGIASGACVNLGGDLRVWGEPPRGDGWTVGVENELSTKPIAVIALEHGAVATSSRTRRRWALAGQTMHHVIDPRTGAPAASDLVAVTVVAGETWWAEILAKVALIAGLDDGASFLKDLGTPALLVDAYGESHAICGMEAWLR